MLDRIQLELASVFRRFFANAIDSLTPFRSWTRGYSKRTFRFDLVAGLTVAGIMIPQAMAQTLLVGIPPVYGLYAVLVGTVAGALWGSSRYVVTAPVAIFSLLTLSVLAPHATPGSPEYIALAVVLAFLVGLIQLCAGFFRLGFLSRLVPHSVLVGFSVSAGIIIALLQVPNLLGFPIAHSAFFIETLWHLAFSIPHAHLLTGLIGFGSLACILAVKRRFPTAPVALIVLGASIPLSMLFDFSSLGVPIVGAIPRGIPALYLPSLSVAGVLNILGSAIVIALIGFIETYAIGKELSKRRGERVNANQEMVGQGAANVAASLVGGYPLSGSISASTLNEASGAKTPVANLVIAGATLVTLLFFTSFIAYLPKTVLAAVIIASVMQLIRFEAISRIFAISRPDGFLAAATFAIALTIKADSGILAGIALALILFIYRIMWPRVDEMGFDEESGVLRPIAEGGARLPRTLIVRPHMSFQYANAEHIVEHMRSMLGHAPETRILVLHFGSVNHIDLTGIEELKDFFAHVRARGIEIYGFAIKAPQRAVLEAAASELGDIPFFMSTHDMRRALMNAPHGSKRPI